MSPSVASVASAGVPVENGVPSERSPDRVAAIPSPCWIVAVSSPRVAAVSSPQVVGASSLCAVVPPYSCAVAPESPASGGDTASASK